MKDEILKRINDPHQLEKLYRTNKAHFKQAFGTLYPELKGNSLADFWNERLNYETDEINWGSGRELLIVAFACLFAGVIAKLPAIFNITEDFFYPRNIGFIIFPVLSAYFAWKNQLSPGKITSIVAATLIGLVFINFLPDVEESDTLILSCVHLLLFLWSVLGFAFTGETKNNDEKRLSYLKYNGDLVVMTTLIVIAGGIMTGVTIGLFSLIGFDIREFYFENIVFFGNCMQKCRSILEKIPGAEFLENIYPSAQFMSDLSFEKFKSAKFEDTAYFEPYYLKEFFTI